MEKLKQASETDLQIANYIANHQETVALMRVRELAMRTHVSPATIIRFTQKMGYASFVELRLAVKKSLANQQNLSDRTENEWFLAETQFPADFEQKIEALVNLLAEATFIYCLGNGSSGAMAEYAQQRFSSLGYHGFSSVATFIPYLATKAEQKQEQKDSKEVCLLFSVSGETPELLHVAKGLRDAAIYSVSITNKEVNTLATYADFSIVYDSPMNRQQYSVDLSSQMPVVYIIERLAKELYRRKHEPH